MIIAKRHLFCLLFGLNWGLFVANAEPFPPPDLFDNLPEARTEGGHTIDWYLGRTIEWELENTAINSSREKYRVRMVFGTTYEKVPNRKWVEKPWLRHQERPFWVKLPVTFFLDTPHPVIPNRTAGSVCLRLEYQWKKSTTPRFHVFDSKIAIPFGTYRLLSGSTNAYQLRLEYFPPDGKERLGLNIKSKQTKYLR